MSPPDPVAEAGQLLRSTREARRLSQARLAERVGISQQRLSKLERGAVDPRLGDLARLFAGLQLRLRIETAPPPVPPATDPDLLLDLPEEERLAEVSFLCLLLRKLDDLPHAVVGRLAAVAHGLPVRALRIDLLVRHADRPQLAEASGGSVRSAGTSGGRSSVTTIRRTGPGRCGGCSAARGSCGSRWWTSYRTGS